MTVRDWLRSARPRLGSESEIEVQLLAAHALGVDRSWLFAHPEHAFPELAGEHLLARRLQGEPLAYILGWREFYGRRFTVDRRVLIPRHETEILVEEALKLAPTGARVVDIGTGSGCVGITIKAERPDLAVTCADVSPAALEVTAQNAADLGVDVELALADLLHGQATFDLIVSNPPYIGLHETLPSEVRDHEPGLALFAGDQGEDIYRRLAGEAAPHLAPGGWLVVEIGHTQRASVGTLFTQHGWHLEEVRPDLAGIDRVLVFSAESRP